MSLEEELAHVRADLQRLQAENIELRAALAAAQQRIVELEAKKTPPPAFAKANTPTRPQQPRQKRAPKHNQARRLERPTQVVEHRLERCPTCEGHVSGVHLARRRQVVDVPPPPPVAVIEHRVFKGWCSFCHAWREAPLDLAGQVLGQGRIGIGIASLVAHLRLVVRAPLRIIQAWLANVHQVQRSVGESSDRLRRVAAQGQAALQVVRERIRASPVVQADETSWRENGQNGYVWFAGTPAGERYFEYQHSRAGAVINTLLGEDFTGVLGTDFYAAYNDTPGGRHQRCWAQRLARPACPQSRPSSFAGGPGLGQGGQRGLPAGESVGSRGDRAPEGLSGGGAADPRLGRAVCSGQGPSLPGIGKALAAA